MGFRDQSGYFVAQFADSSIVSPRSGAHVNRADLVLASHDLLEQRQRENDRTIFYKRAALDNADDRKFLGLDLDRVAEFLLQYIRSGGAKNDRPFHLIVRQPPGNELEILPGEPTPFAARYHHQLCIL